MSNLAQINRVKHVFDRNVLNIVINTLLFINLFYCSSIWSNATDPNLLKLQAVQNFAARIISGTRNFDHITAILKDLRWLPVKSKLYFRDAVLAFECMTGSTSPPPPPSPISFLTVHKKRGSEWSRDSKFTASRYSFIERDSVTGIFTFWGEKCADI